MNEWTKRSIQIANSKGYLDQLHEIYPVADNNPRTLAPNIVRELKAAYETKNRLALLEAALNLEKFPFKDPYIALLRDKRELIRTNPLTLQRITDKLLKLDFADIIEGAQAPKEANTQIGPQFRKWLRTSGFSFLPQAQFLKHSTGISFLEGSDKDLFNFATSMLNSGLDKEPDFIAKSGKDYIVGEAKFLTAAGGHQNTSLQDALRMVKGTQGKAHRVAILDGIIWFEFSGKMFQTVKVSGSPLLSALLLNDYLQSI